MAHHGFYSRESCRTVSVFFSGELRTERQCFGRVEKTGCSLVAHYPFPVTWNRNQIVVWLIYVTEESLQGSWMWDITVWETRPCTGEIMALKILFKTLFRWSSYPGVWAHNPGAAFGCRIRCELQRHILLQCREPLCCHLSLLALSLPAFPGVEPKQFSLGLYFNPLISVIYSL